MPTDTPTEFELGDMAADMQRRREEREAREREEKAQIQRQEARRPTNEQGQTKVTQKWIQWVEEGRVHLNRIQDTRRGT